MCGYAPPRGSFYYVHTSTTPLVRPRASRRRGNNSMIPQNGPKRLLASQRSSWSAKRQSPPQYVPHAMAGGHVGANVTFGAPRRGSPCAL
jgi:hypothetical protein